ncbi:hypothetical protein MUN78_02975 [Leucobacter allii]|uniref:Uncharacterized protein n=1 Tax=Leucobacter allii TaxID=2932247 RepID=A0ABY4FNJ1_9MICO|nr:hypothetical protein [Leucobacter allii]UOQ57816.1 hypothetical protein MUN78_02975 [Leucobacter allii]
MRIDNVPMVIPVPDQGEGEVQADAAREAYTLRYARAAAAGRADDLPLGPEVAV